MKWEGNNIDVAKNINILENDSIEFFRDLTLEDEIDRRLERLRFIKKNKDYIFIGNDDEYYEILKNDDKSSARIIFLSVFTYYKRRSETNGE